MVILLPEWLSGLTFTHGVVGKYGRGFESSRTHFILNPAEPALFAKKIVREKHFLCHEKDKKILDEERVWS